MPILDVEVVTAPGESLAPRLAAALAEAVGEVFGSPLGHTWIRLRELPRADYAESGGGPPDGLLPVFVSVLVARRPPREELKGQIQLLTETIAHICNRPAENVHILYLPEGHGRVAFGGKLVE